MLLVYLPAIYKHLRQRGLYSPSRLNFKNLPQGIFNCIFKQLFLKVIFDLSNSGRRKMFRMSVAGVVFICGIGLSIWQLFQHHWISAVGYVLAGVFAALLILLGVLENYDRPLFVFGFGIVTALGLFGVFAEHRAFEAGRSEVLAEGLGVFVALDPLQCSLPPSRVHSLQETGTRACGMQGISDQFDAVHALQRAHTVPAELAVADGLLQMSEDEKPDPCIRMLREVQQACPNVLSKRLSKKLTELRR
jgi:hypothetical protein